MGEFVQTAAGVVLCRHHEVLQLKERELALLPPPTIEFGFPGAGGGEGSTTDQDVVAWLGTVDPKAVSALALSTTQVTDVGVEALASKCTQLRELDLQCTGVTDAGLLKLAIHCSQLQDILLNGCTAVTDVGVETLLRYCRHLENVGLKGTTETVKCYDTMDKQQIAQYRQAHSIGVDSTGQSIGAEPTPGSSSGQLRIELQTLPGKGKPAATFCTFFVAPETPVSQFVELASEKAGHKVDLSGPSIVKGLRKFKLTGNPQQPISEVLA